MTEREWVEFVSFVTLFPVCVGGGFALDHVIDRVIDAELNSEKTEISQEIDSMLDASFEDLLAQKDALARLANEQDIAYATGDEATIADMERRVVEAADKMDADYETLVLRAYTNKSFTEADFYDLAVAARENGFPDQIIGDEGDIIDFEPHDAKYLDYARDDGRQSFRPLQADFETAYKVHHTAHNERGVRGLASALSGAVGFFATLLLLAGVRAEDRIENAVIDFKNKRKQKNKLGKN